MFGNTSAITLDIEDEVGLKSCTNDATVSESTTESREGAADMGG